MASGVGTSQDHQALQLLHAFLQFWIHLTQKTMSETEPPLQSSNGVECRRQKVLRKDVLLSELLMQNLPADRRDGGILEGQKLGPRLAGPRAFGHQGLEKFPFPGQSGRSLQTRHQLPINQEDPWRDQIVAA